MRLKLIFAGGVIALILLSVYMADMNGFNRAVAEYSVEAAIAADKAKTKQAIEQGVVNDLADQYQQVVDRENKRLSEISSLRRRIRATSRCSNGDSSDNYVSGLIELHNTASNSPDLPKAAHPREVNEETDAATIISDSAADYINVAVQTRKLIEIIESSECFKPP